MSMNIEKLQSEVQKFEVSHPKPSWPIPDMNLFLDAGRTVSVASIALEWTTLADLISHP
jgi:hypothetical protein